MSFRSLLPSWNRYGGYALGFASLPRWARRLYGTPGGRATDLAATLCLRGIYQGTLLLPREMLGLPSATSGPTAPRRPARGPRRDA